MKPSTILSGDRLYRYTLWRQWALSHENFVMFIGLNPSTADETTDDPTIRRCVQFAKRWGFDALCMTNLFAFRATEPQYMMKAADPVGPDNDDHLRHCGNLARMVIAAWGTHGNFLNRADRVRIIVPQLHCLGRTKYKLPRHPLYVPGFVEPTPYAGVA